MAGDPRNTRISSYGLCETQRNVRPAAHSGAADAACGGAFSIDFQARTAGLSWFPDSEEPSNDDIRRTIAAGPADVLLTHDHPELGYKLPGIPGVPDKLERMSAQTRLKLATVVEEVKPKLVVHGHWHHTYVERFNGLTVADLACNRKPAATTILNLETLQTDISKTGI